MANRKRSEPRARLYFRCGQKLKNEITKRADSMGISSNKWIEHILWRVVRKQKIEVSISDFDLSQEGN